jgi:Transmembrane secretion effector
LRDPLDKPLWRNRDFLLLESGQLLSSLGTSLTTIAYPLLTLAVTHSAAKAGIVGFIRLVPFALVSLPAGVAADRWSRKRLMIGADVVRVAAMGVFAAFLFTHHVGFWAIAAVALVEGAAATVFVSADPGALRSVVPAAQLPSATGAREARRSIVRLGGPPLGGALYAVSHAVPFAVNAASYLCSTASLLGMRTPFEERREHDAASLRAQLAEGFRFMWQHAFLRTTAFVYGAGNLLTSAMFLLIVVIGKREGLSPGEIGALSAAVGAGTLVGSLASPLFRKVLSVRAILLLELWTWLATWAFVAWPRVYLLAAWAILFGIAAPVTDSVVVGYRLAITPDRLVGRVESVRTTISLIAGPLGPLAAGLLLEATSPRATVAVVAASGLALALWGTLSPAIRDAPSLGDLETTEAEELRHPDVVEPTALLEPAE